MAAVVPVFDGEALLPSCVEALLRDANGPDLVLLVDDGSRDRSVAVAADLVASGGGRVRLVALGRNHGFAGAVNRGVACLLADARPEDVLVLVNQDCVVREGWLAPLVEALAEPSVAVAGARLLDADGVTLQHAGARVEANGLTSHVGRGSTDAGAWREAADHDYVCGALMATTVATWRRLGPFDEGYAPAYFEEVDFCARARAAGLRVTYVPSCEAVHAGASTSGPGSGLFLRRYHRSRMRFVARHLLARGRRAAWLAAELRWLAAQRRAADVLPALRAYAALPRLLVEAGARRTR